MRKWLLHIFCVGMWCMLTASCSQIMDEPTNGQCDEPRKIVFTLALDAAAGSRATWGENESDPNAMIGTDWENQIAPNQLQVAFYNSNNAYLGKVENLTYFQTEQKNIYRFMGDVPETGVMGNNDKLDCKIMVFANIDEEINENANLANLDFEFGENVELKNIPMWGIKKVNQTLRQGEWNELGTIYLLRAVAKVEVSLDDNLSDEFELQGVTLNRYTTTGFTLPTGWNAESTDETTDLNTEDVLNFGTEVDETPLPFTEENGKYIIYMPEYVNTDEQVTSSNMTVLINNNEYPLEFKYYSEDKVGQAFDVVRNHYYEYIITGVNEEVETSLVYTLKVRKYTTIENEVEFE